MQDQKFLTKNFDLVSNKLIFEKDLLRLDIHILVLGFLEERKPCYTKVTEKYKEKSNRDDIKEEYTNLEKEAIKKELNTKK